LECGLSAQKYFWSQSQQRVKEHMVLRVMVQAQLTMVVQDWEVDACKRTQHTCALKMWRQERKLARLVPLDRSPPINETFNLEMLLKIALWSQGVEIVKFWARLLSLSSSLLYEMLTSHQMEQDHSEKCLFLLLIPKQIHCFTGWKGIVVWDCHATCGQRETAIFISNIVCEHITWGCGEEKNCATGCVRKAWCLLKTWRAFSKDRREVQSKLRKCFRWALIVHLKNHTTYHLLLDHLLLDRSPNIGPLISRWELDKFKSCWNKSFRTSEILTLLYQQFLNLLIFQRMSGPRLVALSNIRWSGVISGNIFEEKEF
jgi:hypothetical protein